MAIIDVIVEIKRFNSLPLKSQNNYCGNPQVPFRSRIGYRLENFSYGKTHNTAWAAARSSKSIVGRTC